MTENNLKQNLRKKTSIKTIQKKLFCTQLILIITLALFLGVSGMLINIKSEIQKRDQNLQNIAESIAKSPLLCERIDNPRDEQRKQILNDYLDSLKNSLANIDVISFVSKKNVRLYHSNHSLINTQYDGAVPEFGASENYISNATGPSGSQRRAYAAVYDEKGNYAGFVMAIMLLENINAENIQIFRIFMIFTLASVITELLISVKLSSLIKESLHGYEPNVFSAMYQIRENILESLNEGIVAINNEGIIQFANSSAAEMIGRKNVGELIDTKISDICDMAPFGNVLESGKKEFNIQESSLKNANILMDCIPIKENETVIGAAAILHDRAEYTKLMEDLTGTRYLVDSMRANNHDFTNKLHVIMGLIQMKMYDEAVSYIENITIIQREIISKIMSAVDEPAIAALLIGKCARASELNIKFIIKEDSRYLKSDAFVPSELLVTVLGNLIDNAYDSMNIMDESYSKQKEINIGIYSQPESVLITVEDTGSGISEENMKHIFESGFSTKGEGRGTGLYHVKELLKGVGGKITAESQKNIGTSFSVIIRAKGKEDSNV